MDAGKQNKRIWELDALRGIAIICVVIVHVFSFLDQFSSLIISWSPFMYGVRQYGGTVFVVLSGLCASFRTKPDSRRGLVVLGCAFALTAVTAALYLTGTEDETVLIQWGVLHTIGLSMLLYNCYSRLSDVPLCILALAIIGFGYYAYFNIRVESQWLFIFGLRPYPFYTMDYFPLCPHLGWYMLGTFIGRKLYKDKKTLFELKNGGNAVVDFLCFCGRNSLLIYMVHLPICYVIANLI